MAGHDNPQSGHPMVPSVFGAQVRLSDETVVVHVSGELCLATAPGLLARLDELERGFSRLILDLRRVTFLDSTGIRLLVQMESRAHADGFNFAVSVEGEPARTLQLVGLADRLPRVSAEELSGLLGPDSAADGPDSAADGPADG
jgi:anti-sigma B factor antagonist